MMSLLEFIKQDRYCRENNVPEGCGCKGCLGEHQEKCADWLVNSKNIGCYYIQNTCDGAIPENEDARS